MVIIDRAKPFQSIILTLTESTTVSNPVYVMKLKHDASRDEFEIILPANISESKERYDLFQLETTMFQSMESGFYSFSVFQSVSDTESIEDGKLIIKDSKEIADADQYIVYEL